MTQVDFDGIESDVDDDIRRVFTYNASPTDEMKQQFKSITDVLMFAAQVIRDNTPESANQTLALQHLVDARMRANAAIATEGTGFGRSKPKASDYTYSVEQG